MGPPGEGVGHPIIFLLWSGKSGLQPSDLRGKLTLTGKDYPWVGGSWVAAARSSVAGASVAGAAGASADDAGASADHAGASADAGAGAEVNTGLGNYRWTVTLDSIAHGKYKRIHPRIRPK